MIVVAVIAIAIVIFFALRSFSQPRMPMGYQQGPVYMQTPPPPVFINEGPDPFIQDVAMIAGAEIVGDIVSDVAMDMFDGGGGGFDQGGFDGGDF